MSGNSLDKGNGPPGPCLLEQLEIENALPGFLEFVFQGGWQGGVELVIAFGFAVPLFVFAGGDG